MDDDVQESSVFDINSMPLTVTSHEYSPFNKSEPEPEGYSYVSARNEIDSINRELVELHENLLKMRVRAHILEVDLATQFNPDTVLDIRQVEAKCQECTKVVEEFSAIVSITGKSEDEDDDDDVSFDNDEENVKPNQENDKSDQENDKSNQENEIDE